MLELKYRSDSDREDDAGVALVVVLIVMLVGVIILSSIAASVIFTFGANNANTNRTQAFISAESARDKMLAQYLSASGFPACIKIPDSTTTAPKFQNAKVVSSGPDSATQAAPTGCADNANTSVFVITATGLANDGTRDTITSTYRRQVTNTNQPGGTTSAQFGTFTSTKLSYEGDFVVRGGDYDCTNGATITGSLWVLKDPVTGVGGNVDLGNGCTVTKSIYAQGTVSLTGTGLSVGGNVISAGPTGSVTGKKGSVGGGIFADGSITFSGTTAASYLAGGAVTGSGSGANAAISAANCAPTPGAKCVVNSALTSTPGTAMFIPTPATVWALTTWVDLDGSSNWIGSTGNVKLYQPSGSCKSDWTSTLNESLTSPYTRIAVDLSRCTNSPTVTLAPLPTQTQTNDVAFIFPAGKPMDITITGSLNPLLSAANAANWPQLFLIHSDSKVATPPVPNCGSGASSDWVRLPSVVQSRIMIYSACGLAPGITNGNGKLAFTGQYYSVSDGQNDAQPQVSCKLMAWAPLLDMGCEIAPDGSITGTGNSSPVPQAPNLVSQIEQ